MTRSSPGHIWIARTRLATAKKSGTLRPASAAAAPLRLHGQAEGGIFVEERGRIARARAFDREQRKLGRNATVGREASGPGAGRQHTMTRHDDGKWVSPERLADLARETAFAEPRGKLAVGERGACRNCARHFVNAAFEVPHAVHVEGNRGKVARLALEQCGDRLDRTLHMRRRRRLACLRISTHETRAGLRLARLRQLHTTDAARTPRDAAAADRRVEERKTVCRHDVAILAWPSL